MAVISLNKDVMRKETDRLKLNRELIHWATAESFTPDKLVWEGIRGCLDRGAEPTPRDKNPKEYFFFFLLNNNRASVIENFLDYARSISTVGTGSGAVLWFDPRIKTEPGRNGITILAKALDSPYRERAVRAIVDYTVFLFDANLISFQDAKTTFIDALSFGQRKHYMFRPEERPAHMDGIKHIVEGLVALIERKYKHKVLDEELTAPLGAIVLTWHPNRGAINDILGAAKKVIAEKFNYMGGDFAKMIIQKVYVPDPVRKRGF